MFRKIFFILSFFMASAGFTLASQDFTLESPILSPKTNVKYNSQFGSSGNDSVTVQRQKRKIFIDDTFSPSLNNNSSSSKKDPYYLKINNVKYFFVQNNSSNKYEISNIIGYNDSRERLFASLLALESDGDKSSITGKELAKANIRLVALQPNGKLAVYDKSKDFSVSNIIKIDAKTINESINKGSIGTFGYFDAYIKLPNGKSKKVIGQVTFQNEQELRNLL